MSTSQGGRRNPEEKLPTNFRRSVKIKWRLKFLFCRDIISDVKSELLLGLDTDKYGNIIRLPGYVAVVGADMINVTVGMIILPLQGEKELLIITQGDVRFAHFALGLVIMALQAVFGKRLRRIKINIS